MYPTIVTSENIDACLADLGDLEVIFATWGLMRLTDEQLDRLPSLRALFYTAGTVRYFARPLLERGIVVTSGAAAECGSGGGVYCRAKSYWQIRAISGTPGAAPLPSGPLLKRMPEYSTWRVTCEGLPVAGDAPRAKESTADGQGKAKDALVIQSSVVKTGSTIFEEEVDAHGQHMQVWHVSGLRITMDPGARTPTVCPDYGGESISIPSTSPPPIFAELDWISARIPIRVSRNNVRGEIA